MNEKEASDDQRGGSRGYKHQDPHVLDWIIASCDGFDVQLHADDHPRAALASGVPSIRGPKRRRGELEIGPTDQRGE